MVGIIQKDSQQRGEERDFKFYKSGIYVVPSTGEHWSNRYLPANAEHSEGCGYLCRQVSIQNFMINDVKTSTMDSYVNGERDTQSIKYRKMVIRALLLRGFALAMGFH